MAHVRHRKFNTKDTYPEQNLDNDLCQAVVARGRMVFLRGQCPQDLDTAQNINSHDPVEQTHKVMQNIRQLLEECGGSMEHLCKVVVYLTDVRHREAVYRTMDQCAQRHLQPKARVWWSLLTPRRPAAPCSSRPADHHRTKRQPG